MGAPGEGWPDPLAVPDEAAPGADEAGGGGAAGEQPGTRSNPRTQAARISRTLS